MGSAKLISLCFNSFTKQLLNLCWVLAAIRGAAIKSYYLFHLWERDFLWNHCLLQLRPSGWLFHSPFYDLYHREPLFSVSVHQYSHSFPPTSPRNPKASHFTRNCPGRQLVYPASGDYSSSGQLLSLPYIMKIFTGVLLPVPRLFLWNVGCKSRGLHSSW